VIVIGFAVGAVANAEGAGLEVVGVVEAGHPLAERLLAGELHHAAHLRLDLRRLDVGVVGLYPRSFPGSHPEGLVGVLRAARGRGPG
jgi:hypothetical protein